MSLDDQAPITRDQLRAALKRVADDLSLDAMYDAHGLDAEASLIAKAAIAAAFEGLIEKLELDE